MFKVFETKGGGLPYRITPLKVNTILKKKYKNFFVSLYIINLKCRNYAKRF